MVKGVWGVKNDAPDVSKRPCAGGNEDAKNSRDRYVKANYNSQAPFGTSQTDSSNTWGSNN